MEEVAKVGKMEDDFANDVFGCQFPIINHIIHITPGFINTNGVGSLRGDTLTRRLPAEALAKVGHFNTFDPVRQQFFGTGDFESYNVTNPILRLRQNKSQRTNRQGTAHTGRENYQQSQGQQEPDKTHTSISNVKSQNYMSKP